MAEHKLDELGIYIISTDPVKGQLRLEDRKYYNVIGIAPRNWARKGLVTGALITGSYVEGGGYLSIIDPQVMSPEGEKEKEECRIEPKNQKDKQSASEKAKNPTVK